MNILSKEIECIAYFTKEGEPKPMRFRLAREDESLISVNVDRVIKKEIAKLSGNRMWVISCESIINNVKKTYEIKYDIDKCKWLLFRFQ